jgi:hypothetical protein
MDISDLLIIHIIVIIGIYLFIYIYLIRVTKCIHFNSEYENFSGEISFIFWKHCRWTGNGCTMPADVPRSSLMACIIFWMWSRQTRGMVSYATYADIARTRRITSLEGPFTAIFLPIVSCPITFVGQFMEKKGL